MNKWLKILLIGGGTIAGGYILYRIAKKQSEKQPEIPPGYDQSYLPSMAKKTTGIAKPSYKKFVKYAQKGIIQPRYTDKRAKMIALSVEKEEPTLI